MQDPKDEDTEGWVGKASALKGADGKLQLPMAPKNLLKSMALHAIVQDRDPVDLIQDIHDAACFWLSDYDMRQKFGENVPRGRGLDS